MTALTQSQFFQQLKKYYTFYTGGFIAFVIVLAILEQMGLPAKWVGYIFLAATIALYAGIGIMSKTADVSEYYVAGRRVPAIFNGMATGADWMSAASFIGMAGTLYLAGYDGLAFVLGWTGGYVLVALFLAPYLRKFGQFTIPDFLGSRYGGNLPRTIGVSPPSSARSPTWWRRSTASASSPPASPAWNSRSACSSAWPASWCAPSSAACAR
jgi:cation/acetate symporter